MSEPQQKPDFETVDCNHEWEHQRQTKETDTYYHIWHVTNLLVCKHCKDVQIQSTYEVPEQCAPWMPFEDDDGYEWEDDY